MVYLLDDRGTSGWANPNVSSFARKSSCKTRLKVLKMLSEARSVSPLQSTGGDQEWNEGQQVID